MPVRRSSVSTAKQILLGGLGLVLVLINLSKLDNTAPSPDLGVQFTWSEPVARNLLDGETNNNTTIQRVTTTRNSTMTTTLPKIIFASVFRNSGQKDPRYFQKFFRMAEAISSEFHLVVYENDSEDDTRQFLKDNLGGKNSSNVTMIFEDNVTNAALPGGNKEDLRLKMTHNNRHKTNRIARARNIVLKYAEDHFSHYDYFAMMDMDMLCTLDPQGGQYDHNILKYALLGLSDDWDVLSFRQFVYFDWWALRYPPMLPDNFLYPGHKHKNLYGWEHMDAIMDMEFRKAKFPDGLLEVESAFALFSFYKMSFVKQKVARYRGYDAKNGTDCEHVGFNTDLRVKLGARIRISPLTYCKPHWYDWVKKPGHIDMKQMDIYRPLPPNIEAKMEAITSESSTTPETK